MGRSVPASGFRLRSRYTLDRYSPVSVLIRMTSPVVTNDGTLTTSPVSSVAGLIWAEAVAPLMPGEVSVTFEIDRRRQVDPDRLLVVELDVDHRVGQEVQRMVPQNLSREVDLFVVRRVHEAEHVALPVEELHLVFIDCGPFHILLGAELEVHEAPGPDVSHAALDVRALVAGRDVVQLQDAAERVLDLDEHAFAESGCL